MYYDTIVGLVVCILALIGSKCEARDKQDLGKNGEFSVTTRKISYSDSDVCKDELETVTCEKIKETNFCAEENFSDKCKRTCGKCPKKETLFTSMLVCRDVGEKGFCNELKLNGMCEINRLRSNPGRFSRVQNYCRKTCGLCGLQLQTTKREDECADKPICERLTTLYNIKNCMLVKHPQLRKRAFKKCPVLCKRCKPAEEKILVPEAAKVIRPVVDPFESPNIAKKLTKSSSNRLPHPPIESIDSDDKPRRGVFYIFTKYLSL